MKWRVFLLQRFRTFQLLFFYKIILVYIVLIYLLLEELLQFFLMSAE